MLKPVFYTRANALNTFQAPWLKVDAATWAAVGGCDAARLSGWNLDRLDLAGALGLLRGGVELVDEAEEPCWWGYVNAVRLFRGRSGATCSLDQMSNRVKFTYQNLDNWAVLGSLERSETTWAENADSILAYGTKEKIISRAESTGSQAIAARTIALNENGWPLALPQHENLGLPETKRPTQVGDTFLELRGWWHTAGWRYYSQAAGVIDNNPGGSIPQDIGQGAGNTKQAQKFTVGAAGWYGNVVWILICKIGWPADNVTVDICADSGGSPGASLGQVVTVGAADIATGYAWTPFVFVTPPALAANTDYWIVISRTGANDGANFYRIQIDEGLHFAAGDFKLWNGGAWVARSPDCDLVFRLSGTMETTDQIFLMASADFGGQFLSGIRLENESRVFTNPYRVGDQTAQAEIKQQLEGGDYLGCRLSCEVTRDRTLRIFTVPAAPSAAIRIDEAGHLANLAGNKLPAWKPMAGQWAILESPWLGGGSQYQQISDRVFLEAVEYDPVSGWIRPK